MRRWVHRLLCRLGWHAWEFNGRHFVTMPYTHMVTEECCPRCGRVRAWDKPASRWRDAGRQFFGSNEV